MARRKGSWYRRPNLISNRFDLTDEQKHEILTSPKYKACSVKIPFASAADAQAAVDNAGLRPSGGKRGSVYKCKYCPHYHITSNAKEG